MPADGVITCCRCHVRVNVDAHTDCLLSADAHKHCTAYRGSYMCWPPNNNVMRLLGVLMLYIQDQHARLSINTDTVCGFRLQ